METANFFIQLYQSKFKFWKVKPGKNFREFTVFYKHVWPPINSVQIQKQFSFQKF
jgi:hypothetical protein